MDVSLKPEYEQIVHAKVKSGRYSSASEVMSEALRLLDERDQITDLHKSEIRKKIAEGMRSLEAGKVADGRTVFARLEQKLDELERNGR